MYASPSSVFICVPRPPRNTIHSNDFGFFKEVNAVIQREPAEFLDPELRGTLSAIGIRTGPTTYIGIGRQTSDRACDEPILVDG